MFSFSRPTFICACCAGVFTDSPAFALGDRRLCQECAFNGILHAAKLAREAERPRVYNTYTDSGSLREPAGWLANKREVYFCGDVVRLERGTIGMVVAKLDDTVVVDLEHGALAEACPYFALEKELQLQRCNTCSARARNFSRRDSGKVFFGCGDHHSELMPHGFGPTGANTIKITGEPQKPSADAPQKMGLWGAMAKEAKGSGTIKITGMTSDPEPLTLSAKGEGHVVRSPVSTGKIVRVPQDLVTDIDESLRNMEAAGERRAYEGEQRVLAAILAVDVPACPPDCGPPCAACGPGWSESPDDIGAPMREGAGVLVIRGGGDLSDPLPAEKPEEKPIRFREFL